MDHQPRLAEPSDAELSEYRSISGWAVVGLIVGLLSPLALVDPLLWILPLAGVLICGRALRQIKLNAPAMIGRKAALAGMWIAVLSLAAAPGDLCYYRWRLGDQARQASLFWFDLLAKNRPEMAFQLTLPPQQRHPLDERIWDFYNDSEKWRKALENYVAPAKPEAPPRLVRTLLALGDSAQVQYLRTLGYDYIETQDVVDQLYAVTFNESGETKTFLIMVRLARIRTSNDRAGWQIVDAIGGVDREGKTPS